MDFFYDLKAANKAVKTWSEKMNGEGSPLPSDTMAATTVDVMTVSAKTVAGGCIIKVMVPGDNQHQHEAIFTVKNRSDLLISTWMPDHSSWFRISASRVKYTRQHVKIVGFNKAAFKRALDVIQDVTYLLVTAVPAEHMEPWVPEIESDELGISLVANCRYFTVGRDIRLEARMEFDKYVDPAKSLAAFVAPQVAHCINNYMGYLERKGNNRSGPSKPFGMKKLFINLIKRFTYKADKSIDEEMAHVRARLARLRIGVQDEEPEKMETA
ncbi:hypothetical protein B0H19DRAFT_1077207 [Mycena capillaripes]|nr:hypothetical protein B0H19DRAFT_1077207 [Mycena capillaripes]